MKGRRPRPLDDGDSGEARVSVELSRAKLINKIGAISSLGEIVRQLVIMTIISNCTASALKDAAVSLIAGNLVAFPTETVYGLGADASNQQSVARIYEVKGRPTDHPLIVHISSINYLNKWAKDIPEYAVKLARTFWPGPMTLILPRTDLAKNFITGGQNTVAIRVPSHTLAIQFLKEFESLGGYGVAAPSANRFGQVSPTCVGDVITELSDYMSENDLILDGGQSSIGIESTIIDCTREVPTILRPGGVTFSMINGLLSFQIEVSTNHLNHEIRASGQFDSHYSPMARVYLYGTPESGDGFIALSRFPTPAGVIRLSSPADNEEYAKTLYQSLRLADHKKLSKVFVIAPNGDDIAVAITDRLQKSAYRAKS